MELNHMASRAGSGTRIHSPLPLDALDIWAAMQLVQLSERSSAESTTTESSSYSASNSNTPKSVSTGPQLSAMVEYYEEIDYDAMDLSRKNQRYRQISDLYDATTEIDSLKKKATRS